MREILKSWMKKNKFFLSILTAGIIFRLLVTIYAFPIILNHTTVHVDDDGYYNRAIQMQDGTLDNLKRAPGYPAFLATLIKKEVTDFGANYPDIRIVQQMMDVATGVIVYMLIVAIAGSVLQGLVFLVLWLFYPWGIWQSNLVYQTTLFTFLLAVSMFLIAWFFQKKQLWLCLVSGIGIGLAALTRPSILVYPLFFVFLLFMLKGWKQRVAAIIILLLGMTLAIAPWTYRNYKQTGQFVLISTEGLGINLWGGNYYPDRGRFPWTGEKLEIVARVSAEGGTEKEQDKRFLKLALNNMKEHPLQTADLVVRKVFRFWFITPTDRFIYVIIPLHLFYMFFAIWGIVRINKKSILFYIPLSIILNIYSLHVATYATVRYSVPVMPQLLLFTSIGLVAFFDWISKINKQPKKQ